jgi:hypothetical protein
MNRSQTIHQSHAGECGHSAVPPRSESRNECLDTARRLQKHTGTSIVIFSAILFLSGVGALIFETLWLRLSGLAFGNSVWAAALILSSFMGGLALGNAIAATSRIRRWRPLHLYALLEVLVAVLGCTIVFGLPALGELLRPVWQLLWNYQPILLGLRFVVSFLILLVPTTAMGLTLPVLIASRRLVFEARVWLRVWRVVSPQRWACSWRDSKAIPARMHRSERFHSALMQDIGRRGGCFSSALGRVAFFLHWK